MIKYTLLVITIFTSLILPQSFTKELTANQTIDSVRLSLAISDYQQMKEVFEQPNTNDVTKLEAAIQIAEFQDRRDSLTSAFFQKILSKKDLSKEALSTILEGIYTLFPNYFIPQIDSIFNNTTDSKVLALCANQLIRYSKEYRDTVMQKLSLTKDFMKEPRLNRLFSSLHSTHLKLKKPMIYDLLNYNFGGNVNIIYSFQRKNRDYPGVLIIKDKNDNFILNQDGTLFSIPQLARSITNLPGYLTNGNTPQGIFSYQTIYTSSSRMIGPTPALKMLLPFEDDSLVFIHKNPFSFDKKSYKGCLDINTYKMLLPQSCRDYSPLFESYYAGMAGRSYILAHGTTLDPEQFRNSHYFPFTPTQGCLCTNELWDETGKLIFSNQLRLLKKLEELGSYSGYLIVIELDDTEAPVSANEIYNLVYSRKPKVH